MKGVQSGSDRVVVRNYVHRTSAYKKSGHNKAHESLMEELIAGFMRSLIGYFTDDSDAKLGEYTSQTKKYQEKVVSKNRGVQ